MCNVVVFSGNDDRDDNETTVSNGTDVDPTVTSGGGAYGVYSVFFTLLLTASLGIC